MADGTAEANVLADAYGGGINHGGGDVTITGSIFGGYDLGNVASVYKAYAESGDYAGGLYPDEAHALVDVNARGGGLYTHDGSLSVTDSTFQANLAYARIWRRMRRRTEWIWVVWFVSTAHVYADAQGGGIEHGNGDVTITDSLLGGYTPGIGGVATLGNQAYVDNAHAYADLYSGGFDYAALAQVDATGYGGGLSTGNGVLAISTTTAALSPTTFQANDAYVRNAKAYANTSSTAFGEIAHANVNAYAAGGGVDHGDGDVTVSDSVFGGFYYFAGPAYLGNQAYVDQVYAHAGYADGAGHTGYAYANVNATAYGGGIRTGTVTTAARCRRWRAR